MLRVTRLWYPKQMDTVVTVVDLCKSLSAYSRSDLLDLKLEIEAKLSAAKQTLAKAKRVAYARRQFMDPDDFTRLEGEIRSLGREHQRVLAAIAVSKTEEKDARVKLHASGKDPFLVSFLWVAKQELTGAQYNDWVEKAKARAATIPLPTSPL